ncbi:MULTISPECIES: DUF2790 domain-containing protein [Pseudomonas]|uniref:DUF2790 domain-containing protein n=1 Tax=Pseudomonas farsensis TaxID=2745492 RepID=A0ABU8QXV0_9PSED|nr:DUF2790 domain-containing protein [Pseudomonas sp. SWRI51]MBC3413634.1 DUF2790 domain-containing protein [Pseudomonas sp. SWRI51]
MKALLILALVGVSSFAFADAATTPASGAQAPVVEQYDYSTNLDIKRVISLSTIPNVCEVVPATMTYEDHQGRVHTLQYRAMGEGCSQS